MTIRGLVRDGRLRVDTAVDLPDNTEVELALIIDGDEEPGFRSRLDAHLHASKAELAAGAVTSFDEVLAEI